MSEIADILDNLGKLLPNEAYWQLTEEQRQEVRAVNAQLKELSKKYDLPCICFVQTENRPDGYRVEGINRSPGDRSSQDMRFLTLIVHLMMHLGEKEDVMDFLNETATKALALYNQYENEEADNGNG